MNSAEKSTAFVGNFVKKKKKKKIGRLGFIGKWGPAVRTPAGRAAVP